jgi:hypothetical protein
LDRPRRAVRDMATTLSRARLLVLATFLASLTTVAVDRPSVAETPAGPTGQTLTLEDNADLHGFDVAMGSDGSAYVGWISSIGGSANRRVRLCRIPPGSLSCAGGIQSSESFGATSAEGLRVLTNQASGGVSLVWFHDTPGSPSGPNDGAIAIANVGAGGLFGSSYDVGPAPSFGQLLDADYDADGQLWTLTETSITAPVQQVLIRLVTDSGRDCATGDPSSHFSKGRLGFASGDPIAVLSSYGTVADPLSYIASTGAFEQGCIGADIAHTWTAAGAFDVGTRGGSAHLVASVDNASYAPQAGTWSLRDQPQWKNAFAPWTATGDTGACAPTSHDLYSDASGRFADVSFECSKLAVANQPTGRRAAIVRFPVGGTPAGTDPQIASTPRGRAVVVWARIVDSTTGVSLVVRRATLPALTTTKTARGAMGSVKVSGPASCLPAVDAPATITAKPATGWKVTGRILKLDGRDVSVVHGASLSANGVHTLVGRATFAKGRTQKTVTARLRFLTCPNP